MMECLRHVRELKEELGYEEKFSHHLGLKSTQNKKFQRKNSEKTKRCTRKVTMMLTNIKDVCVYRIIVVSPMNDDLIKGLYSVIILKRLRRSIPNEVKDAKLNFNFR